MKTDCGVARDLMPLCADGAAATRSMELVREHVGECEDCRAYFEEMKASVPPKDAAVAAREQAEFGQLARLMKKMRRWRVWRNAVIGVLAGALAMTGAYFSWQWLAVEYHAEWPADQYALSLAQLKDGRVVVSADYMGSKRDVGLVVSAVFPYMASEQGIMGSGIIGFGTAPESGRILRLWFETAVIPRNMQNVNRNGPVHVIGNIDEAEALSAGKMNEQLVWRRGDPIPEASGEMEAYYQAEKELAAFWGEAYMMELNDGSNRLRAQSAEGDTVLTTLLNRLETLRAQVPEWQ
jgi:hypothetical protein